MSDATKALIFCGVMLYITGMCTVVIINNSIKEDRACQVTYSHKDRVHVMVGSWK